MWKQAVDRKANFDKVCPPSKVVDGVPKYKLFVKLKQGITGEEENYVLNGLRNQLETRTVAVMSLSNVQKLIGSFAILRTTYVFLIGTIALLIAFFLLLTATTQNIQEALGEYGVLRSVGLGKGEAQRVFLYESFALVLTAGVLGFGVGMVTICLVSSQFYLFIELPWQIEFPGYLFVTMAAMALVTTYLSVYLPMRKIEVRPVSDALKAANH